MTIGRVSVWVAFVLVLSLGRAAFASTLTVLWDPSPDPEVTGFIVSCGTRSGVYSTQLDVGARTSRQVSGLTDGVRYYFVVQAYDTRGFTSAPSEEVSAIAGVSTAALSLTCPAPSARSYDGAPVAINFSPVVSGGIRPVTTACTPPSGTE